jgi:hypothetical protein
MLADLSFREIARRGGQPFRLLRDERRGETHEMRGLRVHLQPHEYHP